MYLSMYERHELDKIKYSHGLCGENANNGSQKRYGDMSHSRWLGNRDQNQQSNMRCISMRAKCKTEQTGLQDFTWFSGTVCERWTVTNFAVRCTTCVCLWLIARQELKSGSRNMAGDAKTKGVTWWTETLSWGSEDRWGFNNRMKINGNQVGRHLRWLAKSYLTPTKSRQSAGGLERMLNSQSCWPQSCMAGDKLEWDVSRRKHLCKKQKLASNTSLMNVIYTIVFFVATAFDLRRK